LFDRWIVTSQPPPSDAAFRYATLAQLGTEMVLPIGLGVYLDYRLDTGPWLTVTGAMLGFGVGMLHLLRVVNRKSQGSSGQQQREGP
jgi:F0F1-type ATP synthase assembly protein I